MVDELHRPGTIPRGPESRSWPASAHSAHSALIQSLQSLRERVLERLDSLETLARQRSASAPAAGAERGPGTDPRAETGRARGDRAQTPRPGRAPGEGVERVSDPARVGSPLARRSLGTRRARADRVFWCVRAPSPQPCPRSGPAKGCPGHSSTRRRPGHGPIGRGRFRLESPGCPGDPPTIPNPMQRRSAQCRRAPRLSFRRKKARIVRLQHQLSDLETRVVGPTVASPASQTSRPVRQRFSPVSPDGRLAFKLVGSPLRLACARGGHVPGQAVTTANSPPGRPVKLTERCEARLDTGPTMKSSA